MGKKWGSNEDIHVGDIFSFWSLYINFPPYTYYQVTALRGKTQVVLRAVKMETYINEGIAEDSPLYGRRERERPLPGQFWPLDNPAVVYERWIRGKQVTATLEEVTAWVCPERYDDGTPRLRVVGLAGRELGCCLDFEPPKYWEPWDAEAIRKLEEYYRQKEEVRMRYLNGEEDVEWPEYPI